MKQSLPEVKQLEANLRSVQDRIAAAARRSGRDPEDVTLVAVTKTVSPERIVAAYELGLRHFGENRVEEAVPKIQMVARLLRKETRFGAENGFLGSAAEEPVTWHMIGHLQRRKVRDAVGPFALIHSVDSVRLASEISKRCAGLAKVMPILLEVNTSGEAAKFGFAMDEVEAAVAEITRLPWIRIEGLMTMAPIVERPEQARPYFRALRELYDRVRDRFASDTPDAPASGGREGGGIEWRHLSMGMTDDFEVAVEEGATLVRIGRAIFGER